MATATTTFQPLVLAYFDEMIRPEMVAAGAEEEHVTYAAYQYVQQACSSEGLIKEISDYFGVTAL